MTLTLWAAHGFPGSRSLPSRPSPTPHIPNPRRHGQGATTVAPAVASRSSRGAGRRRPLAGLPPRSSQPLSLLIRFTGPLALPESPGLSSTFCRVSSRGISPINRLSTTTALTSHLIPIRPDVSGVENGDWLWAPDWRRARGLQAPRSPPYLPCIVRVSFSWLQCTSGDR